MSKEVSKEQAERVLLAFDWGENNSKRYKEFKEKHGSTLRMVFHKYVGWTLGISERGYENVLIAYEELVSLGFLKEITQDEIDYIAQMLEDSHGKPL